MQNLAIIFFTKSYGNLLTLRVFSQGWINIYILCTQTSNIFSIKNDWCGNADKKGLLFSQKYTLWNDIIWLNKWNATVLPYILWHSKINLVVSTWKWELVATNIGLFIWYRHPQSLSLLSCSPLTLSNLSLFFPLVHHDLDQSLNCILNIRPYQCQ